MKRRRAVSLAAIRKNSILLVRKKNAWILPGGKPERRERNMSCLLRELGEELPCAKLNLGCVFLGVVEGHTPHRGDIIKVSLYVGSIHRNIKACGAEIGASAWVTPRNLGRYRISEPTKSSIAALFKKGYLKR